MVLFHYIVGLKIREAEYLLRRPELHGGLRLLLHLLFPGGMDYTTSLLSLK